MLLRLHEFANRIKIRNVSSRDELEESLHWTKTKKKEKLEVKQVMASQPDDSDGTYLIHTSS